MLTVVVGAMENAAELGCPKDMEVDMYYRYLAEENPKKAFDTMSKLLDIINHKHALNDEV